MEPTNEQRQYLEHLSDAEIAAACLIDVLGQLMAVSDTFNEDPAWLNACSGLLRCAVTHLVPQLLWEQVLLMAVEGAREPGLPDTGQRG